MLSNKVKNRESSHKQINHREKSVKSRAGLTKDHKTDTTLARHQEEKETN